MKERLFNMKNEKDLPMILMNTVLAIGMFVLGIYFLFFKDIYALGFMWFGFSALTIWNVGYAYVNGYK